MIDCFSNLVCVTFLCRFTGYAAFRAHCGLGKVESFDQMKDLIPKEIVDTFKLLYADVNDIDLFIAGISERPAHGAILGPTFQVMCDS